MSRLIQNMDRRQLLMVLDTASHVTAPFRKYDAATPCRRHYYGVLSAPDSRKSTRSFRARLTRFRSVI